MPDINRVIQANLNALIAVKFPKATNRAVAGTLGMSNGNLSKIRRRAKPISTEMLEDLAKRLKVTPADLVTERRFDADWTGATAAVTPLEHGKTTVASQSGGGHGLLPSAERHRIVQLEACLYAVLGVLGEAEQKAVEVRAVLNAAGITPPARGAGKTRARRVRG